jgi:hypothetical protein
MIEGMRFGAAILGIGMLVAITAYCPPWVCAPVEVSAASHSCCPHSSQHTRPPCDTTSQTCPYLLLEKTRAIALHLDSPPLPVSHVAPQVEQFERVLTADSYVVNAADLYLRNRVLLI